jgi:hypothetical protein
MSTTVADATQVADVQTLLTLARTLKETLKLVSEGEALLRRTGGDHRSLKISKQLVQGQLAAVIEQLEAARQ